ncbi:MAG: thioredoxin fold domain-containing protein [Acidiferrobacterales bacterium]
MNRKTAAKAETLARLTLLALLLVVGRSWAAKKPVDRTYPAAVQSYVQHVLSLRAFRVGARGPLVTVFLDPNCYYCHKFYEQAMPYVHRGRLRMRVIMVGVIKMSSLAKAAAIVSARSPVAALAANETRFNLGAEEGGLTPPANLPARAIAEIQRNSGFLNSTTGGYTPTIIAQKHDALYVYQGLPSGGVATILKNWN